VTNVAEGYVKAFRKLLEWEWYRNSNTKALFLHCLLRANFRETKWQGKVIPAGSFITSYKNLSAELGLSVQEIRTAIKRLKSTNEITSQATNQFTLINVENWALYQEDIIVDNKRNDNNANKRTTNEQQTNNKRTTTDEELKNVKNVKNINTNTNKASNDAMSVFTDASNGKSTKIDYVSICEWWNTHSKLKEITKITDQRKPNVNARVKEHGIDAIYKMIDQAGRSPFLRGDNSRGFIATFDWCFKPKNFVKVLEGNYTDGKKTFAEDVNARAERLDKRIRGEIV